VPNVPKNASGKYSPLIQIIHWVVALFVICQLAIVVVLGQLRSLQYGKYVLSLHRQIGFAILLICIVRLITVLRHKTPPLGVELPAWQTLAARLVHQAFYAALIAQPLLGLCVAWARGDKVTAFGLVPLPAPWDISDIVRDRLMTAHIITAVILVGLVLVHCGAVMFNHWKRHLPVIERMLPSRPADTLVNRVPVAVQLLAALGIVIVISLATGINAIVKYRAFTTMTTTYQTTDEAAADETSAAQVAWKEIVGIGSERSAHATADRLRSIAATARTHLDSGAQQTSDPAARAAIAAVSALIRPLADGTAPFSGSAIADVDAHLQDLIDTQAGTAQQTRGDIAESASRGHDVIVVTVVPMALLGLVLALLLARSMSTSVGRMRILVRGVETNEGSQKIHVHGRGEFAELMRDMINMRTAIQRRMQVEADQRLSLETDRARLAEEQQAARVRLAEEQQASQREMERVQSVERRTLREQLAREFESQVTGIVESVATTVEALKSTAANLALSAASTTQCSADASVVAETTKNAASRIAGSSEKLSEAARSVRQNAEQSKGRATLGVQEATAAKAEIDLLAVASKQISNITEIIAGVTRQTQLLAVNARIEAARAGEAGRGFCIVADEVKTLAAQTRGATEGIGGHVQQVGTAATRSIQILENMRGIIADLQAGSSNIFAACDDQSKSTEDIAAKATEISSSTIAVADNIAQAERTARATEAMAADVVETAGLLQSQADALQDQVANFVLQLRSVGTRPTSPVSHDDERTVITPFARTA
jgi:methyl-accepting chemotaxis protein/cytochrome b561